MMMLRVTVVERCVSLGEKSHPSRNLVPGDCMKCYDVDTPDGPCPIELCYDVDSDGDPSVTLTIWTVET